MTEEFGQAYARKQIVRQQSPFRKIIKSFYISRVLRHTKGLTIDMGCGAGQILERLPPGSIGIEANPYLVEHLTQHGLNVIQAVDENGFNLSALQENKYETIILSHVLEHFAQADYVLTRLLHDCAALEIARVIIVVPGFAGFNSDITHKTFIDWEYLCSHRMLECEGYKIVHRSYFPGNFKFLGRLFAYHEMMFIYDRRAQHV